MANMFHICAFLVCFGSVFLVEQVLPCPVECSCNGNLVDCGGRNLKSVPYELPKDVRILRLENNDIGYLSNDAFMGLDELQVVTLAQNNINDVPPGTFVNTPRLMSLDLSQNKLRYLEASTFEGLGDLMTLSLAFNSIKTISGILQHTPNLGSLNLGNNDLESIREDDLALTPNIKILDLSKNQISEIHEDAFGKMTKLRYLFLQDNPLGADLPDLNLGDSMLQLVDFTNCNLSRVPQVLPSSVTDLRLSHNNIEIVKETDIRNITNLQLLTLNQNKITNILYRTFTGMEQLKEIWLSQNRLVYIPRGLPSSLKKLYMDSNFIEELELSTLKNDSQLEYLSLEMNRIERISQGAFDNMPQLKVLDLKANQISELKRGTFTDLSNLEYIDLSNNPIVNIEEESFSNLNNVTKLGMSYVMSSMTNVSDNFLNAMPSVEEIEMINSPGLVKGIFKQAAEKGFIPLVNATKVNLMYCDLRTMPPVIKEIFPNIQEFYIDGNSWACDTRLVWLKEWMRSRKVIFSRSEPVVCDRPSDLQGEEVKTLAVRKFKEPVEEYTYPETTSEDGNSEANSDELTDTSTVETTTETTTEAETTVTESTTVLPTGAQLPRKRPAVGPNGRKWKRRRRPGQNGRPGTFRRRKYQRGRNNKRRYRLRNRKPNAKKPTARSLHIRHPKKKAEQIAKWREQQERKQSQ